VLASTIALAVACAPSPQATASPVPTTPASGSPAPSHGAAGEAFQTWTRFDLPDPAPAVFGGGTPSALVPFKGQYLAVGTIAVGCCDGDVSQDRGVIWTSVDGHEWTLADPIDAFDHAAVGDLRTDGTHLVAAGSVMDPTKDDGSTAAAVWVSDDGATWARSANPAPTYVGFGTAGLIGAITIEAVGVVPRSASFVLSDTGLTWSAASRSFNADLRALAVGPDGSAMALGTMAGPRRADGSSTTDLVAWRSADGRSWTEPLTVARDASPIALASDAQGFVALVQPGDSGAPRVWRLGADARPVDLRLPIRDEDGLAGLFADEDLLLVVGDTTAPNGDPLFMAWLSADAGATWNRVADQPAFADLDTMLNGAALAPDVLVVVGRHWDGASSHPLPNAWISNR
jgi:hypothetical protein